MHNFKKLGMNFISARPTMIRFLKEGRLTTHSPAVSESDPARLANTTITVQVAPPNWLTCWLAGPQGVLSNCLRTGRKGKHIHFQVNVDNFYFEPGVGEGKHRFTHTVFTWSQYAPSGISRNLIFSFLSKIAWEDTKLRPSPWKTTWELKRHVSFPCVWIIPNVTGWQLTAQEVNDSLSLFVSVLSAEQEH